MSVEQFGKDLANVVMPPDIIPDQKAKIEGLWTGIATVITDNMKEGVTASRYWMVMTADKIVYDPNEDTLTPDVINIRAWQQAGTEAPFSPLVKWRVNGGTWSETPSETYQLSNIEKTAKNIIVEISKDEDHILDSETIPILDSASDKYTIDLSNNFAMLSANSDGVVTDYTSANTIVRVYRGAGLIDTNIVIYLPTGVTATYDGDIYVNGTLVPANKILQLTGVANYIKNANIPIYLDLDPNIETTFNIVKPSDGKEGTGISAIASWITSDANIVIFNPSNNTYDKSEVVLSSWYRQGADSVQPLAVQWRVSGGVWSTDYTSTLTVPIGGNTGKTSDFTVEISIDNGSHILDSETIAILSTTSDTITIQLTQDSHVIATDKDNIALPSSLELATTTPYVYRGATRVNEKIYISVPDGVQVTYDGAVYPSDTPVAVDPGKVLGISYISLAVRGAIITFYTANPEISPPIEKVFVLATAPTGATGYNARSVVLSTSKQAFVYDSEGNLKPSDDTATITASTIGSPEGINIYYDFIVDGVSVQNSLSPTYVYTPPALYSNMPDIIDVKVREELSTSDIVSQDQMTFVGLREGGNAITVLLSNEAHTLPTQNNGSVNYDGSGTSIKVWEGTTPLITDNSSPYSNSSFRVSIESGDAINVTPGAATYNTYDVTYGNCSALTQDIGTITFTIIVTNSAGGQLTLTKTQSLSKSLQGNNGIVAVATYADLAGITSVFDGMVAFTQDTKKFYVYVASLSRWDLQRVHVDGDTLTGNLADNSMWTIGSFGSQLIDTEVAALQKGFIAQYSDPIQNTIIKGIINSGLESPIWQSQYLGTYPYGRGWNTTYFTVNPQKTYRYVVFIKRTDWSANGGTTLFGFGTNDGITGAALRSTGATVSYPYFIESNTTSFSPSKWYCYVGFVHGIGTTVGSDQGAVYDCETGLKIQSLADFKWLAGTTTANHRVYFANCTNTSSNYQFMSDPRVEEVTGRETQISTLIKNSFITIIPSVTPKYLGAFTLSGRPATANYGDLLIVYSTTAGERGFYQWGFNNSWDKISAANTTTYMISQAWADICKYVNDGYGAIADYVGNGVNFIQTLGANTAFINQLFVNKIEIPTGGIIRSSSYTDAGNLVSGQTKGFYLSSDGTFKASDGYFSGTLAANMVTTANMVVKNSATINPDPYIEDPSAWTTSNGTITFGTDTSAPFGFNYVANSSTIAYLDSASYFPIDTSKKYRVRFWAKRSADANGILYFCLWQFQNNTGTTCTTNGGRSPYRPGGVTVPTTWTEYSYEWGGSDWQSGVKYVKLDWLLNYSGSAGTMYIQGVRFEEAIPTDLIASQAIGGWTIDSSKIYSGNLTGTSDGSAYTTTGMVIGSTGYIASPNFLLKADGSAKFRGYIYATSGYFSGSLGEQIVDRNNIKPGSITANELNVNDIYSQTITLQNQGVIKSANVTDISTGVGLFIDASGNFRLGNPTGTYLLWNNSSLTLVGASLSGTTGTFTGSVNSSEFETQTAQTGENISTPTKTYWKGQSITGQFPIGSFTPDGTCQNGSENVYSMQNDATNFLLESSSTSGSYGDPNNIPSGPAGGEPYSFIPSSKLTDVYPDSGCGIYTYITIVSMTYQVLIKLVDKTTGSTVSQVTVSSPNTTIALAYLYPNVNLSHTYAIQLQTGWSPNGPSGYVAYSNPGWGYYCSVSGLTGSKQIITAYDSSGHIRGSNMIFENGYYTKRVILDMTGYASIDSNSYVNYWKGSDFISACSAYVRVSYEQSVQGGSFDGRTPSSIFIDGTVSIRITFTNATTLTLYGSSYYTYTGNIQLNNTYAKVKIKGTDDSFSATTGALLVSGGIGVAKGISCDTLDSRSGTDSTSTTTGAVKIAGGLGVAKTIRGNAVWGAVGNDYADIYYCSILKDNINFRHVYVMDKFGPRLSKKYNEKNVIGIATNEQSFTAGNEEKTGLPISIGGFISAETDKKYPAGTPVVCGPKGKLTKARWYTRLFSSHCILGFVLPDGRIRVV